MHSSRVHTACLLTVSHVCHGGGPLDADPMDTDSPAPDADRLVMHVSCDTCWEAPPPPVDRRNDRRMFVGGKYECLQNFKYQRMGVHYLLVVTSYPAQTSLWEQKQPTISNTAFRGSSCLCKFQLSPQHMTLTFIKITVSSKMIINYIYVDQKCTRTGNNEASRLYAELSLISRQTTCGQRMSSGSMQTTSGTTSRWHVSSPSTFILLVSSAHHPHVVPALSAVRFHTKKCFNSKSRLINHKYVDEKSTLTGIKIKALLEFDFLKSIITSIYQKTAANGLWTWIFQWAFVNRF